MMTVDEFKHVVGEHRDADAVSASAAKLAEAKKAFQASGSDAVMGGFNMIAKGLKGTPGSLALGLIDYTMKISKMLTGAFTYASQEQAHNDLLESIARRSGASTSAPSSPAPAAGGGPVIKSALTV